MSRFMTVLYGLLAYMVFFVTFLYAIGFVADLPLPTTIDGGISSSPAKAALVDTVLLSIFALQHSIMARKSFKRWWTRIVPESAERSTYVLLASLALALMFWQWRPIPGEIWRVADPNLAHVLIALSFLGWLIVFTSTFLINHFELFGLRQVASRFMGRPMPAPRFRSPLYYRFVRHPIYLGFIIAFWAAPVMTIGHALFAFATTAYVLIGIALEERDLTALFGDQYRHYRERVPMLIPWRRPL